MPTRAYINSFGKVLMAIALPNKHESNISICKCVGYGAFCHFMTILLHYETLPMQYTEKFSAAKNENFQ